MAFLTKAQAQRQAERLAHHIRKYGVKVVIDLRTGAGGGHWGVDTFIGAMAHHIVSRRSQGLTPFYSLVRNGRGGPSPVPGPLCNIYGGWDMVARIVTMGLANHSGRGGPWVISGRRIPRDNGRYYFLGTEFEGGLNAADWTPEYRRFMGAVNAGKLDYLRELNSGITIRDTALCEHSDWAPGRKIDRLGYTQASGIAEMQAARHQGGFKPTTPTPREDWLDMDLNTFRRELDAGLQRHRATQNRQLHTAIQRDLKTTAEQIVTQTFARIMGDVHPKGIGSDFRGTAVEISRDTAAMRAIVEQLPGMIAALEAGEGFDQDKFMAGFQDTLARTLQEAIEVSGEVRIAARPSIELEPPLEGTEED